MNIHVDGNYVNVNYVDIVQWALPIWALFTYNWTKKLLFSVNLYHKLSLSVTFLAQLKRNSFCACICVLQELNASQCLWHKPGLISFMRSYLTTCAFTLFYVPLIYPSACKKCRQLTWVHAFYLFMCTLCALLLCAQSKDNAHVCMCTSTFLGFWHHTP